jgi:hypothetical protein
MDQPEQRGTNCPLGGNSKQHVTFGVPCDFENLEQTFLACPKCVRVANRYLEKGEYASPMAFACWICYSFLLPRLFQLGKYLTPCRSKLTVDTPGFELSNHPGMLSFEIFTDAWNFALRRFVYDKKWTKEEVKTYLTLLCVKKLTIEYFTRCCCNYLLL